MSVVEELFRSFTYLVLVISKYKKLNTNKSAAIKFDVSKIMEGFSAK